LIAGFLLPLRDFLVAWGGIEPPTQGFSMPIPEYGESASTRNIHMNQALTAHWAAINRSHSPSKAPDSRHERQKPRQTFVMFLL
jgi:hypothetical protein